MKSLKILFIFRLTGAGKTAKVYVHVGKTRVFFSAGAYRRAEKPAARRNMMRRKRTIG